MILLLGQSWPELLQALFVASQSQDAGQRESAFRIFATTPAIIEKQHEDSVVPAFTKGFKDSDIMVGSVQRKDLVQVAELRIGQNCSYGSLLIVL